MVSIARRVVLAASLLWPIAMAAPVFAQQCTNTQYPHPLQNGQVADAGQVMADLNCAPIIGLANWSGFVGIGTTSPQQKLWVHNGDIWMTDVNFASSDKKLGFSTDGTLDSTPNVAFGATRNDAYIANWSGSGYNRNLVVVGATGNVGIGTTTPPQKLWVEGGDIWVSAPDWATSDRKLGFSTDGSSDDTPNVAFGATKNDAYIANWSGSGYTRNFVVMGATGNVGIGTTSPSAKLYVNGAAVFTQGYSTSSDARLKQQVAPLQNATALLSQIQGVTYYWRPAETREIGKNLDLPTGKRQIGFIAQDLQKVLPEAVSASPEDGSLSVRETSLIPLLVEAVKSQQKQIEDLKSQVAELRAKVR